MAEPSLCLCMQDASDWSCCFSSHPLYELIWLETFALLGALRDVMPVDTLWRASPFADCRLSGGAWCSTSQPAVTQISPRRLSDRRRERLRSETQKTQSSSVRPRNERAPTLQVSLRGAVKAVRTGCYTVSLGCKPAANRSFALQKYQKATKTCVRQLCYFSSCWTF